MNSGSGVASSDDEPTPEPFFDDGVDPFAPPVETAPAPPPGWHPAYQTQPPAYDGYGQPLAPQGYAQPYPPVGYGPYYSPPRKTNGMAIASLVCSIVGLLFYGITALVGLPLGIAALRSIKSRPDQDGYGMALAGVIIGTIAIVAWVALLIVLIVLINNGTINPSDGNGNGNLALLLTHGRTLG